MITIKNGYAEKLSAAYQVYEKVLQKKKELAALEKEFQKSIEQLIEKFPEGGESRDYVFHANKRTTRKVTDPRLFIEANGDLAWKCVSVSVQKADALKLEIPSAILTTTTTLSYTVTKK